MFEISIFVTILVTIIANSEAKIIQNHRIVPIKINGSNVDDVSQVRIVGGKPAGIEISQYQVGLYFVPFEGSQNGFWCGGILISEQYVLTAAHCFFDAKNPYELLHYATVYLGARNRDDGQEEGQERYHVTSENFIIHGGYDFKANVNDIALIKLPIPIEFNIYINPAILPSPIRHTKEYLFGKTVISSGWGGTNDLKETSSQLLFIKTIIQPGFVCSEAYGQVYNDDRLICINAEGKSTCNGDSGGPHIYRENGNNYVVGVTSFGIESCVQGFPQVLTRVTYYLDWIAGITGLSV